MVKNPGFAVTSMLMRGAGYRLSVAIFAFVDAALIKPLPFEDPNRLIHVNESIPLENALPSLIFGLSGLEASKQILQLARRVYAVRIHDETADGLRKTDGARVSGPFLPDTGRESDPGARLLQRRRRP